MYLKSVIKRDYNSSTTRKPQNYLSYSTNDTMKSWLGKFNPLWKSTDGNVNNNNEKSDSYLCFSNNWTTYRDTSLANYAIGTPSVELFMDAYNQYKGTTILKYAFFSFAYFSASSSWTKIVFSSPALNKSYLLPTIPKITFSSQLSLTDLYQ